MRRLALAGLTPGVLFVLLIPVGVMGEQRTVIEGKNDMAKAAIHESHRVYTPPIDIQAPSRLETATFAMG